MQQQIINKLSNSRFGCTMLTKEQWDFVKSNYTKVDKDFTNGHKWHKCYCQGCDAKYTHKMIDPEAKLIRNSTFNEFYSGSIVD